MIWQRSRFHLQEARENYFAHQRFAFAYAFSCLQAACMAAIHGMIPGLFSTAASDKVKALANTSRAKTNHWGNDDQQPHRN